mgnify:FL=1
MTNTRTYTEADKNRIFADLENRKNEAKLTRKFNKLNREYVALQKTQNSNNGSEKSLLIEMQLDDIQTKMSEIAVFFG